MAVLLLDSRAIGSVANSGLVVALLPVAQRLSGKPGRVSQILVKPRPGAEALVARELRVLARGRADVVPADNELRLLDETAKPINQSTTLFAAISVMVGFLLALNAMLLTMPERRSFIAEMRAQGFAPHQVVLILGFQATVLGVLASLMGLALGDVFARILFHQTPVYLAVAFPVGTQQAIQLKAILLALGAGVFAALLASLPPLLDLRRGRAADAVHHQPGEPGQRIETRTVRWLGAIGALILLAVTGFVLLAPSLTIVGGVMLAVAVICFVPIIFVGLLRVLRPLSDHVRGSMLAVAVVELEGTATRSVALIGVAALAVYGSIAIQGTRHDLLAGPAQGKLAVQRALGGREGLQVQTLAEREAVFQASAREGIKSLGQISTLLLITAALAVASALSAAIWQRRKRLASLKAQGFDRWQLWRALLLESSIVLAIGCTDGALLGLYGHALANRWLELTTGFPAPFSPEGLQVLGALAVVAGITLAVVALPGLSAAWVSPRVGFQE